MIVFLRRAVFCALALLIFEASAFSVKAQTPKTIFTGKRYSAAAFDARQLERAVFETVNQIREENRLRRLVWSEKAAQAARLHSANMAFSGFFSHRDMNNHHVSERVSAAGIDDWEMVGENIAYNSGFENPAGRALNGWLNSAGHRRNILRGNWRETGIGIAVSRSGKFFFTQVFLKRK